MTTDTQTPQPADQMQAVVSAAMLTNCSVRWVVQKKNDMDIWEDCPALTSDCKIIAESNMAYVCESLIAMMARHRLVRRVTFDYLEPSRYGEPSR